MDIKYFKASLSLESTWLLNFFFWKSSFVHSFDKHLLSSCYVAGTELGYKCEEGNSLTVSILNSVQLEEETYGKTKIVQ